MPVEAPLELTYVVADRCHFCDRGRQVLAELAGRLDLHIREVELTSEEGRAAAAVWQVPFPPIVLIEGRLIGYGRLSARRLERELVGLAPDTGTCA